MPEREANTETRVEPPPYLAPGSPRILVTYFLLTFVLSWLFFIPSRFASQGLEIPLIVLGAFGPAVAAVLIVLRVTGRAGLRAWLRRTLNPRVPVALYVIGAFVLPVGIGAYLWVTDGASGTWPVLAPFAVASVAASAIAARQAARIPERRLEFVVAACVLLAGTAATLQRWVLPA